mmetsp:Transcript_4735/g.14054  ORF Transcript_4735/g.14054 Transcript_4735/m.14054 type:complete len:85 (+) Transcript_4735:443-697(+)
MTKGIVRFLLNTEQRGRWIVTRLPLEALRVPLATLASCIRSLIVDLERLMRCAVLMVLDFPIRFGYIFTSRISDVVSCRRHRRH